AIAVPGAIVQIGVATAMGAGLAWALGWSLPAGLVFGLALSVASTVVLLRALQERRLVETERGKIAVGWLIVEDLAMVLALVLLPALATAFGTAGPGGASGDGHAVGGLFGVALDLGVGGILAVTVLKVVGFVLFMLVVGRRVIPWILHYVAHTGSRELFRLAVLAIALGVAFGAAKLFGVSFALGAFFAGMILSESELSHRAAEESLPLRDAFAVLFFVSVGMLFDPSTLWREPVAVLGTLFIIVIGKSVAAFVIVRAFGHPTGTALTVSASLAQIGEFSFILAELGVGLKLLPDAARDLVLAGAILSILINPLVFAGVRALKGRLDLRMPEAAPGNAAPSAPAAAQASPARTAVEVEPLVTTALSGHTVLVGHGRVGSLVADALAAAGTPFLVIEDADVPLAALRARGTETLVGNAADPEVLAAANLGAARRLVLAIPNAFEAGQVVQQAKVANPSIEIVARAHSDAEVEHLASLGASTVIMGEREIARGIVERIEAGAPADPDEPAVARTETV
ncbi:cation:proton antiporter, partial [Rhodoplanes roseus]